MKTANGQLSKYIIMIPTALYKSALVSPPCRWYILNAEDTRVYFKKRKRSDAQEICDEIYGKGMYTIRAEY